MRQFFGIFFYLAVASLTNVYANFLSDTPGVIIRFYLNDSTIEQDLSALTAEAFQKLHSVSDRFDVISAELLSNNNEPLSETLIHQLTEINSRLEGLIFSAVTFKNARVLSIDGGGSRGVIALTYLIELEQQTGRQIYQLFDHICATSTGSIIATLLTVPGLKFKNKDIEISAPEDRPMFATQARDLFLHLSKVIFGKPNKKSRFSMPSLHTRFDVKPFSVLLENLLGEKTFADTLIPVSITSYSLDTNMPVIQSSFHENKQEEKLRKAVRASTAAPGIFLPTKAGHIDGGLAFNNPSIVAALMTWRYLKRDMSEQLLLSLGNGVDTKPVSKSEVEKMYITGIASKIIEILLNGENTNFLTEYLFHIYHAEAENRSYFRFQCQLPTELNIIDAIDEVRLKKFIKIAEEDILKRQEQFKALIHALGKKVLTKNDNEAIVHEKHWSLNQLDQSILDDFELLPSPSSQQLEGTKPRHNSR